VITRGLLPFLITAPVVTFTSLVHLHLLPHTIVANKSESLPYAAIVAADFCLRDTDIKAVRLH
jgi:hypothetical protein